MSPVNFYWLFETWLDAMQGCYPACIITDQDPEMKATITKVFLTHIIVYVFGMS